MRNSQIRNKQQKNIPEEMVISQNKNKEEITMNKTIYEAEFTKMVHDKMREANKFKEL